VGSVPDIGERKYVPFSESLPDAQAVEARVAGTIFKQGYWVGGVCHAASNDFDATIRGRAYKIEVKDESNYIATNNLCVELFQGVAHKPSGISVSESNICIHYFSDDRIVMFKTQPMRLHIKDKNGEYNLRPFGDNHNQGILVPISDVTNKPWCDSVRLNEITKSKLFL